MTERTQSLGSVRPGDLGTTAVRDHHLAWRVPSLPRRKAPATTPAKPGQRTVRFRPLVHAPATRVARRWTFGQAAPLHRLVQDLLAGRREPLHKVGRQLFLPEPELIERVLGDGVQLEAAQVLRTAEILGLELALVL